MHTIYELKKINLEKYLMHNGNNSTDPSVTGGLNAYEIVSVVGAIFAGLASLLGAINCYRQQAKSKETHYSDARIEVKRIGPNGQVQEATYSIHINDDEGYNVNKTETKGKKNNQTIDSKKQTNLITKEAKSDEDDDQIALLAENDAKSDVLRNTTNRKLIDTTLEEFNHTVKLLFGQVEQSEITVTGEIEPSL